MSGAAFATELTTHWSGVSFLFVFVITRLVLMMFMCLIGIMPIARLATMVVMQVLVSAVVALDAGHRGIVRVMGVRVMRRRRDE